MLFAIPMKHLNSPTFFIIYENLQTLQIGVIGNEKGKFLTVLPLFKHYQFHDSYVLHHHRGFQEPLIPFLFPPSRDSSKCRGGKRLCIPDKTDPLVIDLNASVGLRLGHPCEPTVVDEFCKIMAHVPLIEYDCRRTN